MNFHTSENAQLIIGFILMKFGYPLAVSDFEKSCSECEFGSVLLVPIIIALRLF